MWELVKTTMDARPAIVRKNDWQAGKQKVKGTTFYVFLETIADLANNNSGQLACGERKIAEKCGLTRPYIQYLMKVAEKNGFIRNTGELLSKFRTRVFQMTPEMIKSSAGAAAQPERSSADEELKQWYEQDEDQDGLE